MGLAGVIVRKCVKTKEGKNGRTDFCGMNFAMRGEAESDKRAVRGGDCEDHAIC
jgi:hypothetical protein